MKRHARVRLAMTLLLGAGLLLCVDAVGQMGANLPPRPVRIPPASSGLPFPDLPQAHAPASPATSFVASPPAAADAAAPQTPAQRPAKRAEVVYAQGELAVKADNSSLNQILREIGRQTGIKITGGVTDERVFGKYGPAPTSEVLAALLDGTSSNVLLLQSDAGSPGELILTPRQGGVTPPNPNAPGFDDEGGDDLPLPQIPPPISRSPAPPVAGVPEANTGASNPSTSNNNATPGTEQTDPNAVKSPQQIYEQLQRLRQQSQQQTPQ